MIARGGIDSGLSSPQTALHAPHALLSQGWARDVMIAWDASGVIVRVDSGMTAAQASDWANREGIAIERLDGPLLPAMPNLHSHAFQRGFAGLSEHRANERDSFWSWRELMYGFARGLDPESLYSIAHWLYVEMLEAGYTQVCEFHYVHHRADGKPYSDDAQTCLSLMQAARDAGIGITLLPVLYQSSGFGEQPPREGQRRFIRSTESMLALLERLSSQAVTARGAGMGGAMTDREMTDRAMIDSTIIGLAPHSLRAVPPQSLRDVLAGLDALDPTAPVHIHIAEQQREVDECVAWSGRRPVGWLLDEFELGPRWCLVHATHMDDAECARAAASGAVAGLCPATEANLGDGIFDLPRWQRGGGAWGIGSDSHICVSAAEELMLLEYGQRLARQQRNVAATNAHADVATAMWLSAVAGGTRAAGLRRPAGLRAGARADLLSLEVSDVALADLSPTQLLAGLVFASSRRSPVDGVWVGGVRHVHHGRHPDRDAAAAAFVHARRSLLDADQKLSHSSSAAL